MMGHDVEMLGGGAGLGAAVMYTVHRCIDAWKTKRPDGRNGNGTRKGIDTLKLDIHDVMRSTEQHTALLREMTVLQREGNRTLDKIAAFQELDAQFRRDKNQP